MKWGFVIIIWVSLCCQCFLQLGILNWYQLNKATITQKYCENKDKPAMKCHGKCYLKKQMKKAESQQPEEKNIVKQTEWPVFILPAPVQPDERLIYNYEDHHFSVFKEAYLFGYSAFIFRPPNIA